MYVHLEVIFDKAFLPVDKIDSKIFIHINLLVRNDSPLWTFYPAVRLIFASEMKFNEIIIIDKKLVNYHFWHFNISVFAIGYFCLQSL